VTTSNDSLESTRVEVIRSARRRRTISAYRSGDRVIVQVPARLSRKEEAEWVQRMVSRILAAERRRLRSDDELMRRASELAGRYLGPQHPLPSAVRWVDNQHQRWGSCTPEDGTIRLSRRLATMPDYVIDYVLLHELAHLVEAGHGERFWAQLEGYPSLQRARGYLEGFSAAGEASPSPIPMQPPARQRPRRRSPRSPGRPTMPDQLALLDTGT
jgi:predicted metal-dependent hydrolase